MAVLQLGLQIALADLIRALIAHLWNHDEFQYLSYSTDESALFGLSTRNLVFGSEVRVHVGKPLAYLLLLMIETPPEVKETCSTPLCVQKRRGPFGIIGK